LESGKSTLPALFFYATDKEYIVFAARMTMSYQLPASKCVVENQSDVTGPRLELYEQKKLAKQIFVFFICWDGNIGGGLVMVR
jgi:hypothetical protein